MEKIFVIAEGIQGKGFKSLGEKGFVSLDLNYFNSATSGNRKAIIVDSFMGTGEDYQRREKAQIKVINRVNDVNEEFVFDSFETFVESIRKPKTAYTIITEGETHGEKTLDVYTALNKEDAYKHFEYLVNVECSSSWIEYFTDEDGELNKDELEISRDEGYFYVRKLYGDDYVEIKVIQTEVI